MYYCGPLALFSTKALLRDQMGFYSYHVRNKVQNCLVSVEFLLMARFNISQFRLQQHG